MAQQSQNRFTKMLPILLIWGVSYFFMLRFLGPQAQKPGTAIPVYQQAQALEAEGRNESPNVALADRVKKLQEASSKYEEFYKAEKDTPSGWQARFQQVNIFDYLARVEGAKKPTDTHWYDQAETKLKEMETGLQKKTGTVKVEANGVITEKTGDLGQIAEERHNQIRAARDEVNKHKWTYVVLDFLVKATGANPAFSYAFALVLVVVVLKTLTFPFQRKQMEYQRDMMRIQPLLKEMQEKMKGKPPEEVQRRQMEIFKENNVNLAGGCLPMLVMMVVLFPVYWMVRDYEYQFTNATFFWIGSAFSKGVPWLGDNLAQFDAPMFVIYLLSTIAFSALQPKMTTDPAQAQQQKMMMYMMPVMFGVMMFIYRWSSAFMLYWLILNIVSGYQSWVLGKQFGLYGGGDSNSSSGGGGGVVIDVPSKPLAPMTGLAPKAATTGRGGSGAPGRVRPKKR